MLTRRHRNFQFSSAWKLRAYHTFLPISFSLSLFLALQILKKQKTIRNFDDGKSKVVEQLRSIRIESIEEEKACSSHFLHKFTSLIEARKTKLQNIQKSHFMANPPCLSFSTGYFIKERKKQKYFFKNKTSVFRKPAVIVKS